jgi:hypothetical protein
MVERGEELRRNPEIPYHEKMLIVQMIQMLVDQSVELGLRTKDDRAKHHKLMKQADSEDALGVALAADEQPDEKRKPGRPSTAGSLTEMFSSTVRDQKKLLEKIGEYLTAKHGQSDIARLKIALDELHYLVSPVDIKPFRDALASLFSPGIHIVHERGIQDAYKRLTSFVTVNGIKVMIANRKEDRPAIDELKDCLRQ